MEKVKVVDITPNSEQIPIFRFDPVKHRYYLGEKQLTGVTTILGVLAKPALIQWASNEAIKYIKENAHIRDEDKAYVATEKLLEEARTAHVRKRDTSANIGTRAHSWISDYIGGKNPERNEEIAIITDNFLKWVEEAKPKFLASEKVIYSKYHWFAGTLDFIAEIDGKVYLGDVKTGNGIYQEMFWQTSGYQLALEEVEPELKIDGHIIVNPTKEGKLNVESNFFYPENVKGFLAALQIYRIINKYEG